MLENIFYYKNLYFFFSFSFSFLFFYGFLFYFFFRSSDISLKIVLWSVELKKLYLFPSYQFEIV